MVQKVVHALFCVEMGGAVEVAGPILAASLPGPRPEQQFEAGAVGQSGLGEGRIPIGVRRAWGPDRPFKILFPFRLNLSTNNQAIDEPLVQEVDKSE